jgi:predicted nucleotidyltransferase
VTTIVKKKISFLKNRTKEEFVNELKKEFNSHVQEAYIFGSFNTAEFNTDSDLDLLIVAKTDLKFHERHQLFPELYKFLNEQNIEFDLIIYTPEEFKKLSDEGKGSKVGFWSNFIKTSKQVA